MIICKTDKLKVILNYIGKFSNHIIFINICCYLTFNITNLEKLCLKPGFRYKTNAWVNLRVQEIRNSHFVPQKKYLKCGYFIFMTSKIIYSKHLILEWDIWYNNIFPILFVIQNPEFNALLFLSFSYIDLYIITYNVFIGKLHTDDWSGKKKVESANFNYK